MLLREIGLEIPYHIDDNISDEESIAMYRKTWNQQEFDFRLMTRCMTSMIDRLTPRITLPDCMKIIIECVDEIWEERVINLLGVCCIQIKFDIDGFFKMDDLQKKQCVIETVLEAISEFEKKKECDLGEVKKVCEFIKQNNYLNEWYWKKAVRRKHKQAQVRVLHEVENVSIFMAIIDNKTKDKKEILAVQEKPDEWFYVQYLGKLEWISDDEVQLLSREGDVVASLTM